MQHTFFKRGFTLTEMLVAIALITLLSAIILPYVSSMREKSKIKKAQNDLAVINIAMSKLAYDTGKWPNGCPAGEWENPEVYLDDPWAGIVSIVQSPGAAVMGNGYTKNSCVWTAQNLANWKGPYMKSIPLDPWGHKYVFDPDYCNENGQAVVALVSLGPDGALEYKSGACNLNNAFVPNGPPPGDDIVLYPGSTIIPIPPVQ